MRLLRSSAFNILMFGSGSLLSLWCVLGGRYLPGGILAVAQLWGRICIWGLRVFCGITLQAEGLEALPVGGAIIAAQHQSAMDILVWLALLPRPAFVFKKELRRIPLFGPMLEPAGMIPVDRGGGGTALREMVTGVRQAVAAGRQVIIFPEGTRMAYGARGKLRQGIAALARGTGAPVLPAATNSGQRWGRKAFGKHPGPVLVKLHPPLPQGLTREEVLTQLEDVYYGPENTPAAAA
ncbi:MAG: lysophospholipid acyltransferase family protein [Acidocella sp.]|nr:lysophospholipid acyltransferase family protein [Acidocella sp.]